jgi:hypothetical protein
MLTLHHLHLLSSIAIQYRKKIPLALKELGINENSPKIIVLSILAPVEFILYILASTILGERRRSAR